jgi:hypothetical protein
MKTISKFIKTLVLTSMMLISFGLFAQNPPPPNGGNSPGGGNTPVGGGAPIGGGLIILMSLAIGYGAKKAYGIMEENKSNK